MKQTITIAGGGLAGLSLAAGLRLAQVPVTILESGHYPRHRVCGEFISGVSPETLRTLGVLDLFEDAALNRKLQWYDSGNLIHQDTLPHPAYGISRHRLDQRLLHRVLHTGGIVHTGVRARPIAQPGHIWAAGRRPRYGPWIGLKAHVRHPLPNADLEMHGGSNGYIGLTHVEEGWTNICGLFRLDRTLKASGPALLPAYLDSGGNSALASTLRSCKWRENSFSAVAGFELGYQNPMPGILSLGDATHMIPPFTGNGMSMAFQAAECALPHLISWSKGESSWHATLNTTRLSLTKRFRKRMTVAGLLHPLILEPSGRSFFQAMASAHLLPFNSILGLVR